MVVLGINTGPDPIEDLEAFVNALQITFPVLLDDQFITQLYRQNGAISPYPLDYVIDAAGNVAFYSTEYDPEAMMAVIEELLESGTPVEDVPTPASPLQLRAAPNPFNPMTVVSFELPAAATVTLDLHDARGSRVRRLLAESRAAGSHDLTFDGRDDAGRELAAGLYLLRLRAGRDTATRKLTLVR